METTSMPPETRSRSARGKSRSQMSIAWLAVPRQSPVETKSQPPLLLPNVSSIGNAQEDRSPGQCIAVDPARQHDDQAMSSNAAHGPRAVCGAGCDCVANFGDEMKAEPAEPEYQARSHGAANWRGVDRRSL